MVFIGTDDKREDASIANRRASLAAKANDNSLRFVSNTAAVGRDPCVAPLQSPSVASPLVARAYRGCLGRGSANCITPPLDVDGCPLIQC